MQSNFKDVKLFDKPIKILGGVVVLVQLILIALIINTQPDKQERNILIWGALGLLVLLVIGTFLLLFKQGKKGKEAGDDERPAIAIKYDIFLSTAMAVLADEDLKKRREEVLATIEELHQLQYKRIFYAAEQMKKADEFDDPAKAAREDLKAILESNNFIFLYPEKMPTSALIELGYALAEKKSIMIMTPDRKLLPYLAQGLDKFDNVNIFEYKSQLHLVNLIKQNEKAIFKRDDSE
ncbi:MAG: hypothetical protein WDO16_09990 [Bacteroidota bacterium]